VTPNQSPAARADVLSAALYYRDQVDAQLAAEFIDAVEEAVRSIGAFPGIGSTRFAEMLRIPGLRTVALRRFPHIIFYVERPDQVEIWRVLHARRDIPEALQD